MARRLKGPNKASNPAGDSSAWKLTRHPVASSALLEFGPAAPVWAMLANGTTAQLFGTTVKARVKGSIVKMVPPMDTPESHVSELEQLLYKLGARTVRVMPSQPSDKLGVSSEDVETAIDVPQRSLRQVALDRANRVSNPRDREALLALVSQALDVGEQHGQA